MTRSLILIADDNLDTRELYAYYLSMVGYNVETAADGREAVVKALRLRPALIVMDLQMPEANGWTAIRELRGDINAPAIPIVVLTAHEFKGHLKPAALALGAQSFLKKPCLPERLAAEIEQNLQAREGTGAQRAAQA